MSWGGDCYAYGLLALGQVDVVAEATLKLWDWAALVPVIEGAGGRITDWRACRAAAGRRRHRAGPGRHGAAAGRAGPVERMPMMRTAACLHRLLAAALLTTPALAEPTYGSPCWAR